MLSMSFTIPPLMFMSRGELEWRLKQMGVLGESESCSRIGVRHVSDTMFRIDRTELYLITHISCTIITVRHHANL